jgi:unsaturated rhamnogalacturonyl hydrolase
VPTAIDAHSKLAFSRRALLALGSTSGLGVLIGCSGPPEPQTATEGPPLPRTNPPPQEKPPEAPPAIGWDEVPRILERIRAPIFPNRDYPITDFGAASGADASLAIEKAIAACHAAGGGRVVVPPGEFVTGPVRLRSNTNLHVSKGAVLKFATDPARYPLVLTRWEGIECMNYAPLVYAFEEVNVAVTGKGTLDGQAAEDNWWAWKRSHFEKSRADRPEDLQRPDARRLIAMGAEGVPVKERVFGPGHQLRPSFIQPYRCQNVLVEDVTILRSPMWEVHPVLCQNVTVRGVTIRSHGPNNDGCNPDSCRDVLIERCLFDVGDDCIAIKSGKNADGRRVNVPSENIVVRTSTFKDGHGGVVLGSECSGHIRNVFVEDCVMDSPHLERMLRFKNNAVRGGHLENVFVRNVRVGTVAEAVLTIDLLYEEGANGNHMPVVQNVVIQRVTATAAPRVMYVVAFPGAVIDGIRFEDCTFTNVEATEVLAVPGTVEFKNVVIEPKVKPRSLSSRTGPM